MTIQEDGSQLEQSGKVVRGKPVLDQPTTNGPLLDPAAHGFVQGETTTGRGGPRTIYVHNEPSAKITPRSPSVPNTPPSA